jgi:hypothetical protein
VNVACVDPAEVHRFWPLASDLVRRAMTRMKLSEFTPVERDVLAGMALLWIGVTDRKLIAAAVTQLNLIDGEKYCTIVAYGGEGFDDWGQAIERLEDFGRAEGCKAMRLFGRKGWARALPDYKTHALVLQKELS